MDAASLNIQAAAPAGTGALASTERLEWVPRIVQQFPIRAGYEPGGTMTPDYGSASQEQVNDSISAVFNRVKGTKLLPNVDLKVQHDTYMKQVDSEIAALGYKPTPAHMKVMRIAADATVFMRSYNPGESDPKRYYGSNFTSDGRILHRPTNGKQSYQSGIAQRIVNNGTKGDCVDGSIVYTALSHLSGVDSGMGDCMVRGYGTTIDINGDRGGHCYVYQWLPIRKKIDDGHGGLVACSVMSDPTNAGLAVGVDLTKLNRFPHPEAWLVGAKGDPGYRAYFDFTHLCREPEGLNEPPYTFQSFPTNTKMSRMTGLKALEPIVDYVKELNREIYSGH